MEFENALAAPAMEEIKQDSVDETEAAVIDGLDEHFQADYGRSE